MVAMASPRMTEVFVLSEANVTTLAQMNRIPISVAEIVNDFDRKAAADLAKLLSTKYRKILDTVLSKERSGDPAGQWYLDEMHRTTHNFLQDYGRIVIDLLNSKMKPREWMLGTLNDIMSDEDGDTWEMIVNLRKEFSSLDKNELRKRAALTFPDGFFWVELRCDEQGMEGVEMQHCGVAGGSMFSLRDGSGNPHVTIDVDEGKATQVRGKQNALPDRKYWPYIKTFFDRYKLPYEDWGHDRDKDGSEFFRYLSSAVP